MKLSEFLLRQIPGTPYAAALRVVEYINALRADEGDSVEILCQNREADTNRELECVVVCGDWTNYLPRRFYGATVEEALTAAVREMRRMSGE